MQQLIKPLLSLYDRHEAQALLRMLVEDLCHQSWSHFLAYGSQADDVLLSAVQRLSTGEPIQHILGFADFCGHRFAVTPDTLIPRPETAALVDWIVEGNSKTRKLKNSKTPNILDIGTGTGCIAISLALALPGSTVNALDVSQSAIEVAKKNWQQLASSQEHTSSCSFVLHDILSSTPPSLPQQDIIVSNPPYICNSEAATMHCNVLQHDPHLALFVPDNDPLLFYRAIARHALTLLSPGGTLYFELNSAYAQATSDLLAQIGYSDIIVRNDQFGKPRFLRCTL